MVVLLSLTLRHDLPIFILMMQYRRGKRLSCEYLDQYENYRNIYSSFWRNTYFDEILFYVLTYVWRRLCFTITQMKSDLLSEIKCQHKKGYGMVFFLFSLIFFYFYRIAQRMSFYPTTSLLVPYVSFCI